MNRIHYIYKITNKINGKIYIGQTVNAIKRWSQHKTAARNNKPTQIIHHALIKYGIENFVFDVIACCLDQNAANEAETTIVKQEDSYVSINKGYNVSNGGANAPKTEVWKNMMREHLKNIGFQSGHEVSKDTRIAVSIANTGRVHSKEELRKRTRSLKEFYGKHKIKRQMSESHKAAISKKHRICNLTQEQEVELFQKLIAGKSQTSLSVEYNINRKSVKRIFDKLSGETI